MVFGTPKQDTPVGLLAKGEDSSLQVVGPKRQDVAQEISNEELLASLPPISTELLKHTVSQVVQNYQEMSSDSATLDYAEFVENRDAAKKRYSDVLLPAVNSAQSLAASAEYVTPELLAAKLRYERTKALQAKRAPEQRAFEKLPEPIKRKEAPKTVTPIPVKPPTFKPVKLAEPRPAKKRAEKRLDRSERKAIRKKASAIPDMWLNQDEKWYWWLAFGTSVLLYMGISTYLIWAFIYDDYPLLTAVGAAIITYFTVAWYYQGRNLGRLQQSSILVSERQFGELYAEANDIADKLGMRKLPLMYVAKSTENAEIRSLRMLGRDVLIIPSDLAALAYQNELPAISYLIAREFVKIKQGHGRLRFGILPAHFVPMVGSGYAQKCVLTCDRAAAFCKPEGAANGLKLLAVGKTLYTKKAKDTLVPVEEAKATLLGNFLSACAYVPTYMARFQLLMRVPSVQ